MPPLTQVEIGVNPSSMGRTFPYPPSLKIKIQEDVGSIDFICVFSCFGCIITREGPSCGARCPTGLQASPEGCEILVSCRVDCQLLLVQMTNCNMCCCVWGAATWVLGVSKTSEHGAHQRKCDENQNGIERASLNTHAKNWRYTIMSDLKLFSANEKLHLTNAKAWIVGRGVSLDAPS